jgi:hypothetical protein
VKRDHTTGKLLIEGIQKGLDFDLGSTPEDSATMSETPQEEQETIKTVGEVITPVSHQPAAVEAPYISPVSDEAFNRFHAERAEVAADRENKLQHTTLVAELSNRLDLLRTMDPEDYRLAA